MDIDKWVDDYEQAEDEFEPLPDEEGSDDE